MYKAKYLSPMLPSFDIPVTKDFFCNLLKFEVVMESSTYLILGKDNLTIHILRAGKDIGEMEFYLEVNDIDSVWNFIKDKIKGIKHREPFEREYGMREIHIAVPKTNVLLFIGEEVRQQSPY